jgi:N utilization substance protein B
MGKRRKARESTLQILFQLEFDSIEPDVVFESYWKGKRTTIEIREHSRWLVEQITSHRDEIDELIQSVSENWRISRMAIVDRNILRIAVCELLYGDKMAPAIVINEAIEIAKKFSSENGAFFVNGILDAVRKRIQELNKMSEEEKDV